MIHRVLTGLLLLGSALSAEEIIRFGIPPSTTGVIEYMTAGGALTGLDIAIDRLFGDATPANAGVGGSLQCMGCRLRYVTGNFSGGFGNNLAGVWTFGPGGGLSITGALDLDGDGNFETSGELLTGTFTETTITLNGDLPGPLDDWNLTAASFLNVPNPSLLAYFGLSGGQYTGSLSLMFFTDASTTAPGLFRSTAIAGGEVLTQPTPEPSSLLILGTALLLVGGFLRQRLFT